MVKEKVAKRQANYAQTVAHQSLVICSYIIYVCVRFLLITIDILYVKLNLLKYTN